MVFTTRIQANSRINRLSRTDTSFIQIRPTQRVQYGRVIRVPDFVKAGHGLITTLM
jgi:hypothetical protein